MTRILLAILVGYLVGAIVWYAWIARDHVRARRLLMECALCGGRESHWHPLYSILFALAWPAIVIPWRGRPLASPSLRASDRRVPRSWRVSIDFVIASPSSEEIYPTPTVEAVESAALAIAGPCKILPGSRVVIRPIMLASLRRRPADHGERAS